MNPLASSLAVIVGVVAFHAAAEAQHSQARFWRYSSPVVEIGQTGQVSAVHNPACGSGTNGVDATTVIAKIGADALTAYFEAHRIPRIAGYGISTALINQVANDGNRQWLLDRIGLSNGLSNCATQCVVYPRRESNRLSIFGCLSETGGDGLDCGANGWTGRWMGVWNLTHAENNTFAVSCMTGKNWSHNRNRWFWVVATDQNPIDGSPLPLLYR